jgi:hypothetical protein
MLAATQLASSYRADIGAWGLWSNAAGRLAELAGFEEELIGPRPNTSDVRNT